MGLFAREGDDVIDARTTVLVSLENKNKLYMSNEASTTIFRCRLQTGWKRGTRNAEERRLDERKRNNLGRWEIYY